MKRAPVAIALLALALPARADAHVEVLPDKPLLEQEQEFVVRVPDERDIPTTAELAALLSAQSVGTRVVLGVVRAGAALVLPLSVADRPAGSGSSG